MGKRMFLGFDKDAEAVMAGAQRIAKQFNHHQLRPAHILLALCSRQNTTARKVLSGINQRLPRLISSQLGGVLRMGEIPSPRRTALPYTSGTETVLDYAIKEALTTESAAVSTEHLLIGIHQARGTNASKCLQDLGVQLTQIRAGITSVRPF